VRSSNVKGQFKVKSSSSSEKAVLVGVQEPNQPSHLVGPGRRVGLVGLNHRSSQYLRKCHIDGTIFMVENSVFGNMLLIRRRILAFCIIFNFFLAF
jgi:hypothetical protein